VGSDRFALLESALRLSYFTIVWNGVAGGAALVAALVAGSTALAAFALNALLGSMASVVLVWRFRTEQRDPAAAERLERRAHGWIAAAMVLVGLYVVVEALRALIGRSHAEESAFGIALAALSLAVLPWLGRQKLRVASALSSGALRGDGILTLAAAALAAITRQHPVVRAPAKPNRRRRSRRTAHRLPEEAMAKLLSR
jgi:divalent metal cation (Fe/Co/Zn/Cd) transporter